MSDRDIDLACITESWLTEGHAHTAYILDSFGFALSHSFRKNRAGGGVAVILKKTLHFKEVPTQFDLETFEWHGIRLIGEPTYIVITIYRKQEFSFTLFLKEFYDLMSCLCNNTHDNILVLGDFNVHFETLNKSSKDLRDILLQFGLQQSVQDPTHNCGHTLDLIFFNPYELSTIVDVVPELAISNNSNIKFDHFPVFFSIPMHCSDQNQGVNKKQLKKWRNTSQINQVDFVSAVQEQLTISDDQFSSEQCFENKLSVYNNNLSDVLNKYAPLNTKYISANDDEYPEWFDTEYFKERRVRRRLEKKWKHLQTEESHQNFVNQRDHCISLSNNKLRSYFKDIMSSSDSPATLFKTVSKLWNNKKERKLPEIIESASQLANDFNKFFSEKITKLRESIPAVADSTSHSIPTSSPSSHLSSFQPATLEELNEIIKSMTIKSSFDDPLPASLYKLLIPTLLPHILELVNLSLSTGDISGLKESTISPILKKAGLDQESFKNYRPIMNLQFLSKVIEKVVLKRLNTHMTENNLHCPNQHGYKKHHSTETLLIEIVDQTLIGFDSNTGTILILLDMSAAFDTVDLNKLLKILEHKIGLKGTVLKWFQSFLLGRKQKVQINGFTSEILLTMYDVPQGSVLGPVLFNIYVSSLSSVIEGLSLSSSSYADDTNARIKLSLQFQYYNISVRIPDLLNKISNWMNANFLKLNPSKTEIIFLCPPNLNNVPKINGVMIDGKCIRFNGVVKLLGVHFDTSLNFEYHITKMVTSGTWHLKNISKITRYLSQDHIEKLDMPSSVVE